MAMPDEAMARRAQIFSSKCLAVCTFEFDPHLGNLGNIWNIFRVSPEKIEDNIPLT
jgi:hypothetical protein